MKSTWFYCLHCNSQFSQYIILRLAFSRPLSLAGSCLFKKNFFTPVVNRTFPCCIMRITTHPSVAVMQLITDLGPPGSSILHIWDTVAKKGAEKPTKTFHWYAMRQTTTFLHVLFCQWNIIYFKFFFTQALTFIHVIVS